MPSQCRLRTHFCALALALPFLSCLNPARAQTSDNQEKAPLDSNQGNLQRINSEILGLSVEVPEGAIAEHLSQNETSRIRIREASNPPKWAVTIRSLRMPEGETSASPMKLARLFIADARKISPKLVVIDEEETTFRNQPAARLAAEIPSLEGNQRARYDWLFIQNDNRFTLVEQVSPAGPAGNASIALKTILNSLEIRNELEITEKWQLRSRAGAELISRIDERALRRVLELHPKETWYRQHAFDSENNPIDLGYAGISMMETTADQLGNATPKATTDGETGLLVRFRIRRLPIDKTSQILDIDAQAWLSWDREEEFFSTVATARVDGAAKPASMSHIGVRPRPTAGNPIRTLEVMELRANDYTRENLILELPDLEYYLSETERMILPYLLPVVGAPTGDFSVWAWQQERREITRRLDSWQLQNTGGWTLFTRSYPDAQVSSANVDPDGSISSRVVATSTNSERWTRMNPDDLLKHYRRMGIDPGS